jgi:uncharacterized protein YneF (UPF0154 family)
MSEKEVSALSAVKLSHKHLRLWLNMLFALIILVCGILIGSGGTIYFLSSRIMEGIHNPEVFPKRAVERMSARLNLNQEQADNILSIFEQRKDQFELYLADIQPRMKDEIDTLEKEVEAFLTPEQAVVWKKRMDMIRRILLPDIQNGR